MLIYYQNIEDLNICDILQKNNENLDILPKAPLCHGFDDFAVLLLFNIETIMSVTLIKQPL